jgi:hypothetical protein
MGLLRNLKLWLSPPRMNDPAFGSLVFMHISKWPERSYWECEWSFPETGTVVGISLPGGEAGPQPEAREFYLGLPKRFKHILVLCRPKLEQAFRDWRKRELPQDIFTVLKLAGFGLEDPKEQPVRWDVGFETTDDDWLGITIAFVGDTPMDPVVDT